MTEEEREFLLDMDSEIHGGRGTDIIYAMILRHIIEGIDPRTTTKDIIFTLNQRLKELESE